MIIRCLRYRWVLGICMFVLAAAMVSDAAEEKKFTGTIVAAPVDPAGKFAPINLKCQEAEYRIINNKVAQKMQKKWAGKKVDVTGAIEEINGQKTVVPWLFIETGAKPKAQPTG